MKLKTNLSPRRDGSLPKIEAGQPVRGVMPECYQADADGVYDVPEQMAAALIAGGAFYQADGKPVEPEALPSSRDAANVITNEDGGMVNLDDMSRAELVVFADESFGIAVKANDNKGKIIAAIMAAVAE